MRILLLGTGTPNPSLKRMGSGYLVKIGDDVILFDHGPGACQRLLETGIGPTRTTHLFLSHLHYDHCMDYARLVLTRWDQGYGAIPELKVFGPPGTVEMTQALLGPYGAFAADIAARVHQQGSIDTFVLRGGVPPRLPPAPEVIEIQDGQKITGGTWQITAGNVPHAQPTLQCLGYRLDSAEGRLAYSGDAGKSQEFIGLIKGCDVLIHMCHQISGTEPNYEWVRTCAGHREVAEIARAANIKTLVLSHIPSQMDVPGVRERLVCEIADIFEGHIIWGQDLMEISIDGPKPLPHTG